MRTLTTTAAAVLTAGVLLTACGASDQAIEPAAPYDEPSATSIGTTTVEPVDDPGVVDTPQEIAAQTILFQHGDQPEVVLREVVLIKRPAPPHQLVFFRDDVDCAAVRETPIGADQFVALMDVDTPGMPAEGPLPVSQWTYEVGDRGPETAAAAEGWVTVTAAPTEESLEGTVAIETTIDDEAFEMAGSFVATVCEVDAAAI